MERIKLDPEREKGFEASIKLGILKQLHADGLLTLPQLSKLISEIIGETNLPHAA